MFVKWKNTYCKFSPPRHLIVTILRDTIAWTRHPQSEPGLQNGKTDSPATKFVKKKRFRHLFFFNLITCIHELSKIWKFLLQKNFHNEKNLSYILPCKFSKLS